MPHSNRHKIIYTSLEMQWTVATENHCILVVHTPGDTLVHIVKAIGF